MNAQEKKRIFEGHLEQQAKQREIINQKKRKQQELKNNPQESMLFIQKQFRVMSQQMDELINHYKSKEIAYQNLNNHFIKMKKYYVEISYVLKTYDRQFYKESLQRISNTIIELKKKYEPKLKFKFSRRNEDFGVQEKIGKEDQSQKLVKEIHIDGIENRNNEVIVVKEDWSTIGSYKIVNCQNSTVELHDKTQILFLKQLKNCTVKAGLTKSTVFVDHCTNCVFELNCHQLRIHNTTDTTFGIFVTSKAIIEDCNKVIFKPYTFIYHNKQKDEIQFERNGKQNQWKDIQDFNWLKENQKSPHFDLLEN